MLALIIPGPLQVPPSVAALRFMLLSNSHKVSTGVIVASGMSMILITERSVTGSDVG